MLSVVAPKLEFRYTTLRPVLTINPSISWKARTLSLRIWASAAITIGSTNPVNETRLRAKLRRHGPLLFPLSQAIDANIAVVIERQAPLKQRPAISGSDGEVVRRNDVAEGIEQHNPSVVVGGSAVPDEAEVVVLEPGVGPVDAGDARALVHEAQNILEVEEELVVAGGVVRPASRRNQRGALAQRLVREERVGGEVEALPENLNLPSVAVVEEYEVAGVVQVKLHLSGCGGGVGGPHLELGGVGEDEVAGLGERERGASTVYRVVPVGDPDEGVGRARVAYGEAEGVFPDGVKRCGEGGFGR